jgi:HEPN domain-containing protein
MAEDYEALREHARGYLQLARNSLTFESYDECLIHCYRAIDRALQALLTFHHQQGPPTGESLEKLCAVLTISPTDPALLAIIEKAYEARAGSLALDSEGERMFSALEAAEGLRVATEVLRTVEKRMSGKNDAGRG